MAKGIKELVKEMVGGPCSILYRYIRVCGFININNNKNLFLKPHYIIL